MKHRSSAKIMGSLIGLVKPLAPFMILAILMGVAGFLTAILITVFGGFALLEVLGNPAGIALGTVFACVLLFAVARGFLRYAEQACNHYIAFKLLALIRDRIFGALRKLAPAKLEGRDRGNLISIITSDIELLEVFYAHTISPCCIAVIVSLLMLIFIGSFHGALALVALVGYAVVGVLVPFVISRRTRRSGDAFRAEFGDMNAYFMDSLRGLREILQYDMGQERGEQIGIRTQKMSENEEEVKRQGGLSSAVTGFLILFFTLVMLLVAGLLYQQGSIGFEGVLIPVITMASSFGPVLAVANLGSGLAQTLAAGDRVLDILEEEPQVQEVETGKDAIFTGARVEDVSFAYDQDTILQHMNMEIRKGQITGISGPSGSGKSTLLKLLMRFWDTEQGVIRISETPIQEIRTKSLRKMESYVTQETQLFMTALRIICVWPNGTPREKRSKKPVRRQRYMISYSRCPRDMRPWWENWDLRCPVERGSDWELPEPFCIMPR